MTGADVTDSKHTILVVDDEPPLRRMLRAHLEESGHQVYTASDGVEAIRLLAQHSIDLVLCDYKMPDIDGLQLLKQVKAKTPRLPVVMMTGYADDDCLDACLAGGAEDILVKPFAQGVLADVIKRGLCKVKRLTDLYRRS